MLGKVILALFAALALATLLVPLPLAGVEPGQRHFVVQATSFAYDPAIIRVNRGDQVKLVLKSLDVTHGLYLDGYGLNLSAPPGRKAEADFVADRVGKFRFRCSESCGALHPFMIGELVVEPNTPFWRSILLTAVVALGSIVYLWVPKA
ncbi:MAG: hypothetical protein ACE5NP_03000 [Anaerolineae bacterium]